MDRATVKRPARPTSITTGGAKTKNPADFLLRGFRIERVTKKRPARPGSTTTGGAKTCGLDTRRPRLRFSVSVTPHPRSRTNS